MEREETGLQRDAEVTHTPISMRRVVFHTVCVTRHAVIYSLPSAAPRRRGGDSGCVCSVAQIEATHTQTRKHTHARGRRWKTILHYSTHTNIDMCNHILYHSSLPLPFALLRLLSDTVKSASI